MTAPRRAGAMERLRRRVAGPLLLSFTCTVSYAQTTMPAARATAASPLASRPVTVARPSPPSQSGAESGMVDLQSNLSKRAMVVQMTTGMMASINEGNKAVAGNIGGGGGAPPVCKSCKARAKQP